MDGHSGRTRRQKIKKPTKSHSTDQTLVIEDPRTTIKKRGQVYCSSIASTIYCNQVASTMDQPIRRVEVVESKRTPFNRVSGNENHTVASLEETHESDSCL